MYIQQTLQGTKLPKKRLQYISIKISEKRGYNKQTTTTAIRATTTTKTNKKAQKTVTTKTQPIFLKDFSQVVYLFLRQKSFY